MSTDLFTLDDVVLIPAVFSDIKSRQQCSPYVREHSCLPGTNAKLPLFTAPMSCVISSENYEEFRKNGINTIIPRNVHINTRLQLATKTFVALSLHEFKTAFIDNTEWKSKMYILIDVANGHMRQLYDFAKRAKEIHGDNLVLMVGNIANPQTYLEYSSIGVDFVRCGIGTSPVCTTSANSGVHFPMGSLLEGIKSIKYLTKNKGIKYAKIVADGGFNNFDQINKALALGADFVMLGKVFAKTVEACGDIRSSVYPHTYKDDMFFKDWIRLQHLKTIKFYNCYRDYYGMSTKKAQKEFGKEGNKTAEGISTKVNIEYTIEGWIDNFKHYLRSAMSYTNSLTLEDFKNVRWELITPNARIAYFK